MNSPIILPEKEQLFNRSYQWIVEDEYHKARVDRYIVEKIPDHSRSFVQKTILEGFLIINGCPVVKSNTRLAKGDTLTFTLPLPFIPTRAQIDCAMKQIAIIYEHEHFFIINKPAGVLVHRPRALSTEVTIVDWLLEHQLIAPSTGDSARPGIVHRLDKDTSGILVIARTPYGHATLSKLFHDRFITKTYLALVEGQPPKEGSIDLFVGRDPATKVKMKAVPFAYDHTFRTALTHFKTINYFKEHALVQLHPISGRTHQIRVHMASSGHPLVGDSVYGRKSDHITRHALHAAGIAFTFDEQRVHTTLSLPTDMKEIVAHLSKKNNTTAA